MVNHIAAQGYWLIDQLDSPVVELSPGYNWKTGEIGVGRMWFETARYDDDGNLVRRSDDCYDSPSLSRSAS